MMKCARCGTEFSGSKCPSCGTAAPLTPEQEADVRRVRRILLRVILVPAALMLVGGLWLGYATGKLLLVVVSLAVGLLLFGLCLRLLPPRGVRLAAGVLGFAAMLLLYYLLLSQQNISQVKQATLEAFPDITLSEGFDAGCEHARWGFGRGEHGGFVVWITGAFEGEPFRLEYRKIDENRHDVDYGEIDGQALSYAESADLIYEIFAHAE